MQLDQFHKVVPSKARPHGFIQQFLKLTLVLFHFYKPSYNPEAAIGDVS